MPTGPLQENLICLKRVCRGVFAVGDGRGGNIKRAASAGGEGSIVVSFVHRVLSE